MKGDLETVGLQLAGVILNMTDSVLGGLVQFKESSSSQCAGTRLRPDPQ